ncbi:hypothetical protein PV326_003173 [Microctonus aethiopoides]|nr:hypothetical protein PV326_003173 [Microctonus aethiopoides]
MKVKNKLALYGFGAGGILGIAALWNIVGKKKQIIEEFISSYKENFDSDFIIVTLSSAVLEYKECLDSINAAVGNTMRFVTKLPSVSRDAAIYLDHAGYFHNESLYGGYYHSYSGSGNAVFSYRYRKGIQDDKLVSWLNESQFITDRNTKNCILLGTGYNKFDDNKAINSFIASMNYVKSIIQKYNIQYFSIAGDTNLFSAFWYGILSKLFPNDLWISPRSEDQFFSLNSASELCTPDFIAVSRKMAPYGMIYYPEELVGEINLQHYFIVGKALYEPKNFTLKYRNKLLKHHEKFKRDLIMKIINERIFSKFKPKVDGLKSTSINWEKFDLTQMGKFETDKTERNIVHLNNLLAFIGATLGFCSMFYVSYTLTREKREKKYENRREWNKVRRLLIKNKIPNAAVRTRDYIRLKQENPDISDNLIFIKLLPPIALVYNIERWTTTANLEIKNMPVLFSNDGVIIAKDNYNDKTFIKFPTNIHTSIENLTQLPCIQDKNKDKVREKKITCNQPCAINNKSSKMILWEDSTYPQLL